MKVSAKANYACKALLELALHWPNTEPVQISTIASKHRIPMKFLPHILIQLKQLGYVDSIRGQKGGYGLIKAPKDIKLIDVVNHFDDLKLRSNPGKREDVLESIWQGADETLLNYFTALDFEEIVKRQRKLIKVPMYTI
ncbi:MAG: hypothetical protein A2Z88_05490 [Omnitrophica WOR_2 bacterium GWA2_47_8]|nr:MAG: hypothetical protein A2Z88_05490 [Omnitrophica WOR_2 bacterium GWA2_47_8]